MTSTGIGCCVWLTGLPGSGKSTTAEALAVLLQERGCPVTLLDGDALRQSVSRGLGFDQTDRHTHNCRVAMMAAALVRQGQIVLCALVSPYRATRAACRAIIGSSRFLEVFVDTPLEVCVQRDPKGLYQWAHRGEIPRFTGVSDPYEPPEHPEIVVDTVQTSAQANAQRICEMLAARGVLVWP